MSIAASHAVTAFFAGFVASFISYQIGYWRGRSAVQRWLRATEIHH